MMNQRIRELYEQAHSIRNHTGDPMRDGNPPTVYWQGEVSAERFAELIVKEVFSKLEDEGFEVYEPVIKKVKKHFAIIENKGWLCPKCGVDRTKSACPRGYGAAVDGSCPMILAAQ